MKTYYATTIRETAEALTQKLRVQVLVHKHHMYGNENNYVLTIGGDDIKFAGFAGGSTDAIGGFLEALEWIGLEVVAELLQGVCGQDYMAGQICMLPDGHEGSHR